MPVCITSSNWNGEQKKCATFFATLLKKTSWKAMLRVLSLTFKPFLQQIRLLQVASILTSDWIRLPGSQEIYDRSYITCCKRSLLGPVKHEACRDANFNYSLLSATTFCNLQQPDLLQDRFDSWVVKCATSLFNFLFNNVAKQVAHF